jgi:Outer membrane protein beta-barrel domain
MVAARCNVPDPAKIGPDTPLRLATAAVLAYPDGSMTASGLRKEAKRGRLVIERTAGKDYTTLHNIEHMRELCRQQPKVRDSGSAKPDGTRVGRITHHAVWLILDGRHQESTECGRDDRVGAERKLEAYLNRKHSAPAAKTSARDPDQIPVADVLALYAKKVVPTHARPKEALQKIGRLLAFFGDKALADINGDLCREFASRRSTLAGAREDLVVLRSAVNFHREEGHCHKVVSVVLPEKGIRRERWCTRSEVARLLLSAWRFRESQKGGLTTRCSRQAVMSSAVSCARAARGRLGLTNFWWFGPQTMIYVTGGGAWAKIDTSEFLPGALATTTAHQESNTRSGWTIGAGTEYAVGYGWSVKSEFLYVKFDDYTTFTNAPFSVSGGNIAPRTVKLEDYIWRAGLNYKFW